MITISEISDAFRNGTPEEHIKSVDILFKTPEFQRYLEKHAFDLMSPRLFEAYKRIKGGFL
jgi:hypothetical protein